MFCCSKSPGRWIWDERLLALAAAVSVDYDYFSQHSHGSGMMSPFLMPMPMPPYPAGGEVPPADIPEGTDGDAAGAAGVSLCWFVYFRSGILRSLHHRKERGTDVRLLERLFLHCLLVAAVGRDWVRWQERGVWKRVHLSTGGESGEAGSAPGDSEAGPTESMYGDSGWGQDPPAQDLGTDGFDAPGTDGFDEPGTTYLWTILNSKQATSLRP